MGRLRSVLVAVVAAVSLSVQGFVPAVAATSSVEVPFEAADYLSAMAQAKLRGHRVLVGDELTEDSTTWVNPDGSLTTETFGGPVRVRDAAGHFGWRDLDFSLVFDADGFVVPRSGLMPLRVSGGGSESQVLRDGLVSVSSSSGVSFGFGWDGALPKPVLEGDSARFADVLPDVDLLVRLDASGFEQFFEVKARPSVETLDRLKLLVRSHNVRVVENASGGFDFVAASGEVASIVAPSIYDSSDEGVAPVSEPIVPSLVSGVLDLGLDESFFDREDLVYPVIVDPAVALNPSFDTYVSTAAQSTDFSSATELLVGTPDAGASRYRSYLNFSSTAWQGQDIISASMKLYLNWSWSCTPKPFTILPATLASSATRWTNQPIGYTTGSVSRSAAAGYNSSCGAAYVVTDITPTVTYLAPTVSGNAGFSLRASDTDSTGWKRFNSFNASVGKPSITVTYNRYPGTPVTPSVQNAQIVSGGVAVSSLKPLFTSKASDPDSDLLTLTFKTYASATSTTATSTLCSVDTASNVEASCRPTTPLVDGQTYFVRATSFDGSVSSKLVSQPYTFTVIAAEPVAPTITCPYVNGYSSGAVPTAAIVCTVTTNASPENYRAKTVTVTVSDSVPQTFVTNADGSSSNSFTLKAGSFQHRLKAKASGPTGVQSVESSYVMSFGYTGVILPQSRQSNAYQVSISSYARNFAGSTASQATLQWREYGSTSWNSEGEHPAVSSRSGVRGVYDYAWEITGDAPGSTLPSIQTPQTIQARVCFEYQPMLESFCTDDDSITITRMPSRFGAGATSAAGPGVVSLTSGAFQTSAADFSQSIGFSSVGVSRSYGNTVGAPNISSGIFGPGWNASISSDAAATASFNLFVEASGLVTLYDPNLGTLVFEPVTGGYQPFDDATRDTKVVLTSSGTSFTATDEDGSTTYFAKNTATGEWELRCSQEASTSKPVISEYDADGFITRVGYGSGTCSTGVGFYGMYLSYQGTGTNKRLSTIAYYGYNPATGVPKSTLEITYSYTGGLLTKVTNNVNGSETSYEYDSLNRLVKQSTSGFAGYRYKYDTLGRLTQVLREHVGSTSVEATFVYGDVLPSNTNVPALSVAETSKWGQSEAPVYTAAVFDSQKSITLDGQNTPQVSQLSSEWRLASFFFTDASGTLTNTANYGNSKWLFTATLMDANKNVYAGFDADGIEKVLTRTEQDGFGSFDPTIYASKTTFETQIRGQEVTAGLYVKETWSPVRTVMLQGVATQVRTHTSYSYDENAPTSALYGLVTSQVVGLVPGDGASSTNLTQLSKSVNIYDPIDGSSATGATSGWTLKSPTLVKLFDADNQLISETKAIFNQYGQVTKTISAGSTGADGRSEVYTYYSNAPNTIHPECGSKPEWEFLLCYTEYPTTPLLPNRWISEYDYRLNASRIDEVNLNGIQRTTKNTYLDDSRLYETTIEVVGNQSLTTRNLYDPVKLINNGTERYLGATLQSATHKTFDDYGRQTSYTNSLGETETTSYIPGNQLGAGSLQTVTNQQNTITYTYGSANEPRSLVTALTVQGANYLYEYNATYDQLGRLTKQTGPNNLYQAFSYTDSNQVASMSYGSQTTTWFTWQRTYDGYGHVATETEPNSSDSSQKVNYFTYDPSDRLTSNEVVTDTSCNKNSYSYDNAGNRLTKTVTTNSCSNPTSTTTSHSYNSFSQLTNTGYVYDQLGRNTYIPSADAPNQNGAISLAYNINDKVTFIGQNNTSTSFTYEAEDRRLNETSNGVTTTRHYTDSSDNPTWTTQTVNGQTKTETYTPSLGTGLTATTTTENNTVTTQIQLYDLRGNTATTVDPTTNTATTWNNYDEFGNPAATNPANTNLIKYNTYGQAERATNTSGLILMGARVYNPATNQFTSPDPIKGGNENTYTYPNSPLSRSDMTGKMAWWLELALTIAVDAALSALAAAFLATGVGAVLSVVILLGKSLIGSLIVSLIGMFVDGNFTKAGLNAMIFDAAASLVLTVPVSKVVNKIALKKIANQIRTGLLRILKSVFESVLGYAGQKVARWIAIAPEPEESTDYGHTYIGPRRP